MSEFPRQPDEPRSEAQADLGGGMNTYYQKGRFPSVGTEAAAHVPLDRIEDSHLSDPTNPYLPSREEKITGKTAVAATREVLKNATLPQPKTNK